MKRWRSARGLVGVAALTALIGCTPTSGRATDPMDGSKPALLAHLPDGRRLNFRCRGRGGPAVVFESGWGASSMEWAKVQTLTSARRMTCSYDRAGYGFSDPGPVPRDAAAIVADLEKGLKAGRIAGPYILVGHSAGGLYVRLFAARHPSQVAGMVLVDPSVVHQDSRFARVFGPRAASVQPLIDRTAACLAAARAGRLPSTDPALVRCAPAAAPPTPQGQLSLAAAIRPSLFSTQLSELQTLFTTSSDEVAAAEPARIPQAVIVLTAGGTSSSAPERPEPGAELWARLHDEIAAKSVRGASRLIPHTSHMMMFDQPEAIAQAIEDLAAARIVKP
jgi:pimeloyl-ACP methyl ester carboxylesterase